MIDVKTGCYVRGKHFKRITLVTAFRDHFISQVMADMREGANVTAEGSELAVG